MKNFLVVVLCVVLLCASLVDAVCNTVPGSTGGVDAAPIAEVCQGTGCKSDCSGPAPGYYITGVAAPAKFPTVTSVTPATVTSSPATLTLSVTNTFPASSALNPPVFKMRCNAGAGVAIPSAPTGSCKSNGSGSIVCTGVYLPAYKNCGVQIGTDFGAIPGEFPANADPDFTSGWSVSNSGGAIEIPTPVTKATGRIGQNTLVTYEGGTACATSVGSITIIGTGFGDAMLLRTQTNVNSFMSFTFDGQECQELQVLSSTSLVCTQHKVKAGSNKNINIKFVGGYSDTSNQAVENNMDIIAKPSSTPPWITAMTWPTPVMPLSLVDSQSPSSETLVQALSWTIQSSSRKSWLVDTRVSPPLITPLMAPHGRPVPLQVQELQSMILSVALWAPVSESLSRRHTTSFRMLLVASVQIPRSQAPSHLTAPRQPRQECPSRRRPTRPLAHASPSPAQTLVSLISPTVPHSTRALSTRPPMSSRIRSVPPPLSQSRSRSDPSPVTTST
eukprot:comp22511_c0_seq3/m.56323 comp22511_c0_seq3/g.56323  ORF comp22511_c0_seq3/g.56323 comp22511_c0_seq3/m.56323 type:complete len:502 (+) comp22511_c0_seq3:243-1748(+)